MVGITGTNGKTTTTHLVGSILRAAGMTERQIGTLSGTRTTPEAPDLQRRLAGYVRDGVGAVVAEVSSHALAPCTVNGVRFDAAGFTNLGRDHLDLHVSMEAYFHAKASLFTAELANAGVTNLDDPYGRLLLDAADIEDGRLPDGRCRRSSRRRRQTWRSGGAGPRSRCLSAVGSTSTTRCVR
ncbi:MAG: Mur ligase family protein [Ilumatobacteraceae bacterium]